MYHQPVDSVRRLPITLPPYPDETVDSYVHRLADANRCPHDDVAEYLRIPPQGSERITIDVDRLANASGYSSRALTHALPELTDPAYRFPFTGRYRRRRPPAPYLQHPRPACRQCVERRLGVAATVHRWVTHVSCLCVQHRRWLGYRTNDGEHLPIDPAPDVMRAHRQHRKLIRKHGLEAVHAAYIDAASLVQRWCEQGRYRVHRDRRLTALGEIRTHIMYGAATLEAACYPDIINVTSVLASPNLVRLGLTVSRDHPMHIYAQIGRRIGFPDFGPSTAHDPIIDLVHRRDPRPTHGS